MKSKALKKMDYSILVTPESLELTGASIEEQLKYFKENAATNREAMCAGGAVHFKGFDLMKTQKGFMKLSAWNQACTV